MEHPLPRGGEMSAGTLTQSTTVASNITSWTFAVVFIVTGVLNLILVHPVPGLFYLVLSLMYFPQVNIIVKKRFGFAIPLAVKIILGLLVLWATLAVTDLADILGL